MNRIKNKMGGRPPKNDPANNRISVNLSNVEYADFLTLFEKSGVHSMASFIKARIFNETFRVVKVDGTLLEYTQLLSSLYGQYRAIGVNYNQTVATLKSKFEERKALVMLYKLEQQTAELVFISRQITALSQEFRTLWLQNQRQRIALRGSKLQHEQAQSRHRSTCSKAASV